MDQTKVYIFTRLFISWPMVYTPNTLRGKLIVHEGQIFYTLSVLIGHLVLAFSTI